MQPSTRQMKQQVKLPHGETDTALRVFAQGARRVSGSVMITRDTLAHPFFRAETYTEREAWLWIIMQARWKSGQARAGDLTVDLQRGELAASVRFMAEAWQWTPARVQRYIERLKKVKMICVKTDTGISLITVCNYDKFQTIEDDTDTGPIQDRYRTDTKENKDVIKEGKREAKASPKKRGTRLPDDWFLPKAWGDWAVADGYRQDVIRTESENFKDYWRARAGPTASKLDWEATWRIWMRKAPKGKSNGNGNRANGNTAPESRDRFMDEIADIARSRPSPGRIGH